MKILFNSSTNTMGGVVQNAANFVRHAVRQSENEFVFVVSHAVLDVLRGWDIDYNNIHSIDSTAKSVSARRILVELERQYMPDVVYTMAGPAYVKFKAKHVMGISNPYITHADLQSILLNRSKYGAVVFGARELLKGVYARFSSDYFVFQTETARKGFCRRFGLRADRTVILPNALGDSFFSYNTGLDNPITNGIVKIFVPCAYYPHKNLEIIFDICLLLKLVNTDKKFLFVTTAPEDSIFSAKISQHGLQDMILNIGPYNYNDAHSLYSSSSMVFIPSILETFSTSYLEAIAMAKTLVVADKVFSREVCGNYAHYYSPLSSADATQAILCATGSAINLEARNKIISQYGSQKLRFERITSILAAFLNGSK